MSSTTSHAVITAMKSIFSRHGLPETLHSDNGPQFRSQEMAKFTSSYGIRHVTSSPQSNGMAERFVQTAKQLLKQSSDLDIALLHYEATPLPWCNRSPSELLMGRCVQITVPQISSQLIPQWRYLKDFQTRDLEFKKQ